MRFPSSTPPCEKLWWAAAASKNLKKLQTFHKALGDYSYMDPACGCGNFLVVAYTEMRAFELELFRRIRDVTNTEVLGGFEVANTLNVRPEQFFGIEIEEWPAAIARTAMFLVDHQANLELSQEFGQAPDRLPISDTATIVIGNTISIDWASLVPAGAANAAAVYWHREAEAPLRPAAV